MTVGAAEGPPPAATGEEISPRHWPSWLRHGWLLVLPMVLAGLSLRFLVPGRSEIGSGVYGGLARLGDQYPAALAVSFFVLFALLAHSFRNLLPFANEIAQRDGRIRAAATTWLVTVLVAVAAALVCRTTLGRAVRVSGTSMLPNLEPADLLLVDKLAYGVRFSAGRAPLRARTPRRGDIVVFQASAVGERGQDLLVKRVIGLPGDRVSTRGGMATINGWNVPFCDAGRYLYLGQDGPVLGRLAVEFLEDRTFLTLHTPESIAFEGGPVQAGEVFVLGDDRNLSRDSRAWNRGLGAGVPLAAIEGAVWRILGWDREGHVDRQRLFIKPGLAVHLPGIDTADIEDRIARCLLNRPQNTWPPPP